MAHVRQQILTAVKALLDAVVSAPWRSVHVSPFVPPKAAMPCLLLYHVGETSRNAELIGVRRQERAMTMAVQIFMPAPANPASIPVTLDLAASAIETALPLSALQAYAEDIAYLGDEPNYEPDDQGYVSDTLSWSISFSTREGRPDTLGTN